MTSALSYADFVALVGFDDDTATEAGFAAELQQLRLLVVLEDLTGEDLPLELFESVEGVRQAYEWYEVIWSRNHSSSEDPPASR